jgi:ankyrin repeat protein
MNDVIPPDSLREDRPWDDGVDSPPDSQLVTIAHACFDFARAGDTERLRAYIENGVPANLTDATGNTLLMLAAYHGHAETVGALVALGADPDRTNDRGQSPLAGAIFKGEDAVVMALLTAGADPDVGTPSGRATAQMFDRSELLHRAS